MYSCGPTVYDHVQIGNLRSFLLSDLIRRTLEGAGFTVKQVMNITDFGQLTSDADEGEDKMTLALRREDLPMTLDAMHEVAGRYLKSFLEDAAALDLLPANVYPRASEHVKGQVALIATLLEKGYAYKTSDGVYFDTGKFSSYGKLGSISLKGLREGARIEANKEKRNPTDFAIWKSNRNLGWDAPWGRGFPGWHIECSAMAMEYLGKSFDIHTGGIDLIPVHHNNEIAQSEAATGKPFARYWLHNEFITVEGRKISKSLGNSILLHNIVDRDYSPLAYRYWLLTGHYRSPMNFTWEALDGAQTALTRLWRHFVEEYGGKRGSVNAAYEARFLERLRDDLDTPGGLAIMWELIKDASALPGDKRATLLAFDRYLGLGLRESAKRLSTMKKIAVIGTKDLPLEIREKVKAREKSRAEKRFDDADRLRGELERAGYALTDTADGTEVAKAK